MPQPFSDTCITCCPSPPRPAPSREPVHRNALRPPPVPAFVTALDVCTSCCCAGGWWSAEISGYNEETGEHQLTYNKGQEDESYEVGDLSEFHDEEIRWVPGQAVGGLCMGSGWAVYAWKEIRWAWGK
jgi:hypothetical protein